MENSTNRRWVVVTEAPGDNAGGSHCRQEQEIVESIRIKQHRILNDKRMSYNLP